MGQLSALFYKNWVLYKRGILGNVIELFIPVLFMFIVILVRKTNEPTTYIQQSFYTNPSYSHTIDGTNPATAFLKYFHIYKGIAHSDPRSDLYQQVTYWLDRFRPNSLVLATVLKILQLKELSKIIFVT